MRRGTRLLHLALRLLQRKPRGDDLYEDIDTRLDMAQGAFLDLCDHHRLEASIMIREPSGVFRGVSIRRKDSDWPAT